MAIGSIGTANILCETTFDVRSPLKDDIFFRLSKKCVGI